MKNKGQKFHETVPFRFPIFAVPVQNIEIKVEEQIESLVNVSLIYLSSRLRMMSIEQ